MDEEKKTVLHVEISDKAFKLAKAQAALKGFKLPEYIETIIYGDTEDLGEVYDEKIS